ncbi:hypothetical protein BST91_11585 [Nonlabens tegetincola]|uniref:tetratricopeptide repeat protein n=1 Tax=Nonlabens tegetincola TaxID=323273 RepID=UPI000A202FD8|nr:hypothetical protein [Nonlabens tegetincola]ARN72256.1 hypothetical protein BST91_11585 [Nonlabens tegetincola]
MKTLYLLLVICISQQVIAQSPYEKAMNKAFTSMKTDLIEAAPQFEQIARVEKENWLPTYYAAFCYLNSSWGQNPKDQTALYLKKAQEQIDNALLISPDNTEVMVLQALLYTAYITMDSSAYGMKLSPKVTAIYEKAMKLTPNNPRVVTSRAQWLIGSAKFFGKDITPYCSQLDTALELFEKETPDGYAPRWGKEGTIEQLKNCQ